MYGVNKVILVGNLGKNPEIVLFPQEGKGIDDGSVIKKAVFPLATKEIHRNREGQRIEQTDWHTVVCWRGLADVAEKLLKKGTQVYIEGKLQSRSWVDKEGNRRYATEVVAEDFMVLGNRNGSGESTVRAEQDPYIDMLKDDTEPLGDLPF